MRLCLNNINVSFGANEVLKNVSFEVNTGEKIALVGRNGSGKTTLLRVLTGEQEIDPETTGESERRIEKTGKFNIGYLKQIAFENENITLQDELLKVFKDILVLKDQIEDIEGKLKTHGNASLAEKYEKLLNQFNLLGGYTYQKEYNQMLKKFGFSEEDKNKLLSEFSGGQRTKISLIKLLLTKPDLLVLDEPTNHLDISTIEWLEEYLSSYPKAIVVVSHDRAFLDRFVGVVYEIERGKIKKYNGNYSAFVKQKDLEYSKNLKAYEAYQEEKDRLQTLADRFRYKATKAKMAQSKLKQIDRMEEIEKPEMADLKAFSMNIKPERESSTEVINIENLTVGYDRPLSTLSLILTKKDRVGIVGGNGLGKSTLLKTIMGKVPPLKGKIKFGTNLDIGYFDQQSIENITKNQTVLENYQESFSGESTLEARTALGAFCFSKDDVFKNIKELSGGEKVRLELLKILKKKPNFLVLDEPTNHMDIVGKEALEKMLEKYEGTLLFVSHDRYFVNKLATSLIVFENGGAKLYKNTTYSEYEQRKKEIKEENVPEEKPTIIKEPEKQVSENKNIYLQNKERAKQQAKLKKLETQIAQKEAEIKQLNAEFSSPDICSDYIKLTEIQNKIELASKELERLMDMWMELGSI